MPDTAGSGAQDSSTPPCSGRQNASGSVWQVDTSEMPADIRCAIHVACPGVGVQWVGRAPIILRTPKGQAMSYHPCRPEPPKPCSSSAVAGCLTLALVKTVFLQDVARVRRAVGVSEPSGERRPLCSVGSTRTSKRPCGPWRR